MDIGKLPPETESGRTDAGAGSAPLHSADWDKVAGEMRDATDAYSSMMSGLTGDSWSGPASVAMAAAAAPYRRWMDTTGIRAEQSTDQARIAASTYEAAFAMEVPPQVAAVNRRVLMLLSAAFLVQDTPAVAAFDADNAEIGVLDANLDGPVAQATGASATTNSQAVLPQLIPAVLQTLQDPALPLSSPSSTSGLSSLNSATPPGYLLMIGSTNPLPKPNPPKSPVTGAAGHGGPAMVEAVLAWLAPRPVAPGSAAWVRWDRRLRRTRVSRRPPGWPKRRR